MYQHRTTRNIQELNEHGRCVDKLDTRSSTNMPGEGRLRDTLCRKEVLWPILFSCTKVFGTTRTKGQTKQKRAIVSSFTITTFLCPYGVGVDYINHGKNGTRPISISIGPQMEK